jgi:hypothetical protein
MKKFSLLVIFSLILNAANTQNITSIGEGYEITMSAPGVDKTRGQIVHVQNDLVFSSPTMIDPHGLQCLQQADMQEVWNVLIEEKWKHQNVELVPDTTLFLKNGAIVVIAIHFNNKLGKAIIYGRIFNTEGKEVETRKLTSLVAPSKKDIKISALVSRNDIVIHSISNLKTESSRVFQAVWIDENYDEVTKQVTQIEGPQEIENIFYDAHNSALYMATYPKSEKTFDFSKKHKYVLRFKKDQAEPVVEAFKFEDFNAALLTVAADTASGQPYIFGLAENKLSKKIAETFVIALNPETLKEKERYLFQISKEVVDRITETKVYATIYESSKAVNLELIQVHFTKDDLIVVYENIDVNPEYGGLKSHYGQYVLRYSANFKKVTQIYVPNFGFGNSKSLVDTDGKVRLFFVTTIKRFNKANPTLPPIQATKGMEDMGLFEATIDASNKIIYENIFAFKPNNNTAQQKISLVEVIDGKTNIYVTASTFWSQFPTYIRALKK